jgi:hypothetical protein
MGIDTEIYDNNVSVFSESIKNILQLQKTSEVTFLRKEGELLLMIKQEPSQPVKYYMNKSQMSARWFNEILKQLIASKLVSQEPCQHDSRRKLLR